ncbi:MAG TPA: mandelate racemase/muconate lactonizing enzyme family protein [Myxococcaceae bacterium]|nr:mandelate racemase/muconate lactonizing enzyme family protein [Myxococcaceae bacterium]
MASRSTPPLRLERSPLVHPLAAPLVTAHGPHIVRRGWLLTLTDAEGRVGRGEAMPLAAFGTESYEAAEASLGELCRRFNDVVEPLPATPEELGAWLAPLAPTLTVRHALELAALELQAVREQKPLSRWLWESWARLGEAGERGPCPEIEVNALLSSQQPTALADEAVKAQQEGARSFKIKVASGPVVLDVLRLKYVREALGPEARIRIDANAGWRDRHQAKEALRALSAHGPIELCEEPLPVGHLDGLKALRGNVPALIGADETLCSPNLAPRLIELGAVDVLVLKPMMLGGLLPAMALARQGRDMGVPRALVTSSLDGVVARAGAAHLAAVIGDPELAHGLWTGSLFVDEPDHPFAPRDGRIRIPDAPGLGVPEALTRPSP